MPRFVTSTVTEILGSRSRPGLQRVATSAGRAYVLTDLVGPVGVGDPVVLNTTAVDLGLGTGGWHVVHWNLARDEWSQPGPGHIMKLRYTSLQTDTGAAEEQRPGLPESIGGLPVVACSLHSQVGVVATVLRSLRPAARIAYLMTDGAALPLVLSDLMFDLRQRGIVDATVTAGHAFGGDLEAVTVASALVLARHVLAADVVVAGMGPGVVGTGSTLGTTAIEVAGILDTVSALGGLGVLCVRASSADPRERHRGISHHTRTTFHLARSEPVVALPADLAGQMEEARVVATPDVARLLARHDLTITSMGRGPADDPAFFAAAGAAAAWAADQIP